MCDKVVSVKELHVCVCVFVTKLIVVCVTKLCVKEGCGVDGGGGRTERTGVHRKTITPHKDVQNYLKKNSDPRHINLCIIGLAQNDFWGSVEAWLQ